MSTDDSFKLDSSMLVTTDTKSIFIYHLHKMFLLSIIIIIIIVNTCRVHTPSKDAPGASSATVLLRFYLNMNKGG